MMSILVLLFTMSEHQQHETDEKDDEAQQLEYLRDDVEAVVCPDEDEDELAEEEEEERREVEVCRCYRPFFCRAEADVVVVSCDEDEEHRSGEVEDVEYFEAEERDDEYHVGEEPLVFQIFRLADEPVDAEES